MMDVYQTYLVRSQYYRNLFDPVTTFMRSKDENGKMRDDFTQFDWGWDYTEGGPWQNSFTVPHDTLGLASLFGGRQGLINKLDQLFDTPPYYNPYWYGTEIHEMTEMAAVDFGQCALSNQPSFHIPYLYTMMGKPNKAAYWVRKAQRELFHWNVGFPGDEDNGSMAGWYVFSAMGFYPSCPSVDEYVLGSPGVKRCVIHTHKGTDFVINAIGNDQETVYWQDPVLNGNGYDKVYLKHGDIMNGGQLDLTMTSQPVEREYSDEALPYSVSK
jgi:predicted alpha-1,2-mannosidase